MRTDRTLLCADCAVRFAATETRCPRCDGTTLFDLTRPLARKRAIAALRAAERRKRARPSRRTWDKLVSAWLRWGVPGAVTVAFLIGSWLTGSMLTGAVLAIAALWVLLALVFIVIGIVQIAALLAWPFRALATMLASRPTVRPRSLPRVLPIDDRALLAESELVEVRGIVRVKQPVASPLGHKPAAAWRVVGDAPLGEIDDAGATRFEVVDGEGQAIEIDPAHAYVALEVDEAPRMVRPDAPLEQYLVERGLAPDGASLRLAETVLADGDPVVVEGAIEVVNEPDGYRDARPKSRMRERPGAPLLIRRP